MQAVKLTLVYEIHSPASSPSEDNRPVTVRRPEVRASRFVFTCPHSGDAYAPDLMKQTRLPVSLLRRSEDAFVDALMEGAPALGAPLVIAHFPRAFLDPNRAPDEFDPEMFADPPPAAEVSLTARAIAGLGVVPRVAADGRPLYDGRMPFSEAKRRMEAFYTPYHDAVRAEIDATRARFGEAVVIDCHSMPAASARGADIVLGDRFGASCDRGLALRAEVSLRRFGFSVVRNRPYAGGWTTEHYGRPDEGVQALQIEINRSLYMDEARVRPGPGFAAVKRRLTLWMQALVGAAEAGADAAE